MLDNETIVEEQIIEHLQSMRSARARPIVLRNGRSTSSLFGDELYMSERNSAGGVQHIELQNFEPITAQELREAIQILR